MITYFNCNPIFSSLWQSGDIQQGGWNALYPAENRILYNP